MPRKKTTKKTTRKKTVNKTTSRAPFTHIDRSTGQLLRKSDLRKDKPWIGPESNNASVEELEEPISAKNA